MRLRVPWRTPKRALGALGLASQSHASHPVLSKVLPWLALAAPLGLSPDGTPSVVSQGPEGHVPPPNIVLVLADDLGWGDLDASQPRGFTTPALDHLAAEGVRFTDFYTAQSTCTAARAALFTGCYPNRIGLVGALGPDDELGLADGEVTLAELARSRGYATALFGKWHLGWQEPFRPQQHGFDAWYGLPYSNDMWPYHPETPQSWPDLPTFDGERVVAWNGDQSGLTEELTRRAVDFIEQHAERPFFLCVAHPMPHAPLSASPAFRGSSERGAYGDVLQELDASTGRILDALERRGLSERTLVMFTSDNGPWLSYGDHAGSSGPLREGKGTSFEGGLRVPFLARWPGRIPPGRACAEPAMAIDLLPTIAELIGAQLPSHPIDGLDIAPLLTGVSDARSPHEALFFYYNANDLEAVRSGPWKLHFPHGYRTMAGREPGRGGRPGQYDTSARVGLELYDLASDPGETRDVAAENLDVVARLQRLADGMRADLGDDLTGVAATGARAPGRIAAP
jgi:arylsulfatase A